MTYVSCEWWFCPNHLADHERGTPNGRGWRKDPHGKVFCHEHAHLIDNPQPVKANR